MPSRPRQHELERESFVHFQGAIPAQWVFREKEQDYGIDAEVEVFDERGNATGHVFLVQLKATDLASMEEALRDSVKVDFCQYCNNLQLPVLLVRYCSADKNLYVQWMETFDPYYVKKGQRHVAFTLSEADRWDGSTPERLLRDIVHFNQIRTGTAPLPISLLLKRTATVLGGVSGSLVESALRRELKEFSGLLSVTNTPSSEQLGTLELTNQGTSVNFRGIRGFTAHIHDDSPRASSPDEYAHDILACLAIGLLTIGKPEIAVRLVTASGCKSSMAASLDFFIHIIGAYIVTAKYSDALDLAEVLYRNEDTRLAAEALSMAVLERQAHLTSVEQDRLERHLRMQAELAAHSEPEGRAAHALYNYGRFLAGRKRLDEAFDFYKAAARRKPEYLETDYFRAELGGLLFSKGKYFFASRWYASALVLKDRPQTRVLYADTLLFYGHYREAHEQFLRYGQEVQHEEPEWCLKRHIVSMIQSTLQIDSQRREPEAAANTASIENELDEGIAEERIESALLEDALCPLAWFNYGVILEKSGKPKCAFLAFMACGLIRRFDPEAWANAVCVGLGCKEIPTCLLACACTVAYTLCGERFVEQVHVLVESQPPGFSAESVLESFNQIVSSVCCQKDTKEPQMQLRLWGDEGTPLVVELSDLGTSLSTWA